MHIGNFVAIDSIHGKLIVNRHCDYQAESLIKTGMTHIEPELNNILAIVSILPKNAVVIDAGANVGFVSVPIANALRAKGGVCYAFEVQEFLYYALCGTVALNDLGNWLKPVRRALGASDGYIDVPVPDYGIKQDFGTLSLAQSNRSQTKIGELERSQVELTSIDNLALPRLDFLKIDVEGMEIEVLNGALHTINTYRPWCWIEYWKVDHNLLRGWFTNKNYFLYKMDPLNLLCVPKERTAEVTVNAPIF